ncbi:MAG: adenylate/guanylate cyclase domain-containing protein [Alphaproteobacteria bacterium]|nr:adenylate/guanylate cyclase domain-containing protein [Alphaproteobacteria bacterium]
MLPRLTHAIIALAVSLAVLLAYMTLGKAPLFADLESEALNTRFRLRGTIRPGPETVIVMIDDTTVAELGQWPLSREYMAEAVDRLAASGARVIIFDLLFSEPESALSPVLDAALRAAREQLEAFGSPVSMELDRILRADEPDRHFANSIAKAGNVLIPYAFVFSAVDANEMAAPKAIADAAYARYRLPPGAPPVESLKPVGFLVPPAAIIDTAAFVAHVTIALDSDGSLRFEHPVIGHGGEWYPSLPVEAVRAYLGLPRSEVAAAFGEGIEIGGRFFATDGNMRLPVNHYGPTGTFPTYSFVDLIRGRLPEGVFRDRVVLVGGHALGIGDTLPSPFTQMLSGTEHYATVVDNLLHGRTLIRNDLAVSLDFLAIVIGGLAAAAVARVGSFGVSAVAFVALFAGWSGLNLFAFAWGHLWLNFVFPSGAMIVNFTWSALYRAVIEERQRRQAERHRRNLRRYFSPSVADALADQDEVFAFDRMQVAAVMFVDIIGSTQFSERMAPTETMNLLRGFQRRVERTVFANNGTVDKFLGDGAMACFGVPQPGPDDPVNAITCARALASEIADWRASLAAEGKPLVEIGIGIHYGPVVMGDLGGEQQFAFTVIGDTVNVASRLESLTRTHDATIVISEAVMAAAKSADASERVLDGFSPLPPQRIRGRDQVMHLWAWRGPTAGAEPGTGK